MSYRIFISHKTDTKSNRISQDIFDILNEEHEVFFDKESLEVGAKWKPEILKNLLNADVVIVILDKDTAQSHWVQREIDMARARNISILPLRITEQREDVKDALDRFDLHETQSIPLGYGLEVNKTYETIANRIEPLGEETIANQKIMFEEWDKRRNPPIQPTEQLKPTKKAKKNRGSKPSILSFTHENAKNIIFHIATGDASRMRGYDVLVNTENNYMQMARFYQTNTLSYAVRKNGAYMENRTRLIEDTIQTQLYNSNLFTFPVPETTVLATSAGHPESIIRTRTDYRYILHAAAVRFDGTKKPPNQPVGKIPDIIENCLEAINKIDTSNGEIKGKNDAIIVSADKNYQPINSIIFPAFGAGEGGKVYKDAAEDIISTFATTIPYCINEMKLNINNVGFSVYSEDNVEEIENIFMIHGFVKV